MPKTTAKPRVGKPRPDFPPFPRASGRWAKTILGRFVYFGKVADGSKGEAALTLWLDRRDDLPAGHKPRTATRCLPADRVFGRDGDNTDSIFLSSTS